MPTRPSVKVSQHRFPPVDQSSEPAEQSPGETSHAGLLPPSGAAKNRHTEQLILGRVSASLWPLRIMKIDKIKC